MSDDIFPSGPWTGFYNYTGPGDKHRMNLHLSFSKGRISGDGNDDIGLFLISGGYTPQPRSAAGLSSTLGGIKAYDEGVGEKRGIWGRWKLLAGHGGFHIWPLQSGSGDATSEAEEITEPRRSVIKIGHLVRQ